MYGQNLGGGFGTFKECADVWFNEYKEYINVDVEETEAACINGVYSGNCYATIYYDSAVLTRSRSSHLASLNL